MINIDNKFRNIQVFIYCSTKCGSMTLTKTFNKYYKAFHVHNQKDFIEFYKITKYTIFDVITYNANTNNNIYIIDVYRTPLKKNKKIIMKNGDNDYCQIISFLK